MARQPNTWPTVHEHAVAPPAFAMSQTKKWSSANRSVVYDAWKAAISSYMSAAQAAVSAYADGTWVSTGQTYTGASKPATPASELVDIPNSCGAGSSSSALLQGNYQAIRYDFYGRKATKEYRWVEDVAPVTGGQAVLVVSGITATTGSQYDDWPNYTALLTVWKPSVNSMLASMCDYKIANEYYFYRSNWGPDFSTAMTNLNNAFIAYLNPICNAYLDGRHGAGAWHSPYYIYPNSVYWYSMWSVVAWTYNGIGSWYSTNSISTSSSVGTSGTWHKEYRYTSPVKNPTSCANAVYISTDSANWDPVTSPPTFTSRLTTVINNVNNTIIEQEGVMRIGNFCGDTFTSSGPDPFLIDFLTQLEIDDLVIDGYTIEGEYHPAVELSVEHPGSNYLLQTGSPLQGYNTLKGAYVFDLHLKKWGKYKWDYSVLVPLGGANSGYTSGAFSYTDLGVTAGLLRSDGLIYLFDQDPSEGFIRYGKMGYYRLGMVHFLETMLDFRDFFIGTVRVDSSLDGRNLDSSQYLEETFNNVLGVRMYPNMRYRWYTITISGKYDLQYMEVRGNISARR